MLYLTSFKKIFSQNNLVQLYFISFLLFISSLLEILALLLISFVIVNASTFDVVKQQFEALLKFFSFQAPIFEDYVILLVVISYILLSVIVYYHVMKYSSFKVQGIVSELRSRVIAINLNQGSFEKSVKDQSKKLSNIINDVYQISFTLNDALHLLSKTYLSSIILLWLVTMNTYITLTLVSMLIIFYGATHLLVTSKVSLAGRAITSTNEKLLKNLTNTFGYIKEIIFHNIQPKIISKFEILNNLIAINSGQKSLLVNLPRFFIDSLILLLLVTFVVIANSSFGDFQNVFTVLATFGIASIKLLPAIQNIFYYSQQIISRKANLDNLVAFFEKYNQVTLSNIKTKFPSTFSSSIIFKEISYIHDTNDTKSLSGINFEIELGTKVALKGPSGSGKSTLLDLILGLRMPSSGIITFDGIKIQSDNVHLYRKLFSYIPQKIFISEGTIEENILLFSGDEPNQARLEKAMSLAEIDGILIHRAEGLGTHVSEFSQSISGGERQVLGFARAFYDCKDILVLDEATSSMDLALSKKMISRSFDHFKTVICVTHQTELLNLFDRVITLKDGCIEKESL